MSAPAIAATLAQLDTIYKTTLPPAKAAYDAELAKIKELKDAIHAAVDGYEGEPTA